MDYKKIGDLIKEKRVKKNLTQKELADILYITDRAVSKWERGKSLPDISMLKKICEVLSIDINDMLEIKKKDEHKIKRNVTIFLLGFLILLMLFLILIVNNTILDNENNTKFCNKDLKTYYIDNKNNRTIFLNCIDNVYIEGKDLRWLLTSQNFDLELYLNSIKNANYLYDGGSVLYKGDNYSFLKCNSLNGNKDIIIGDTNLEIQDSFCQNNYKEHERCIYTDFFRVVDILDSYGSDDDRYVFVTLDQYQNLNPINVKISKGFIDVLEKGEYYEFKFMYYNPNDYKISGYYDIFYNYELINISKTDKRGLEQVSSNKCEKLIK